MAKGATLISFDIELSDVDRGVYESLSVKAAQHPSESAPYLVARVLAYALEYEEGLSFTGGLFSNDEPALWVRDFTDQLMAWIEVGTPDAARLHKASKAADRVAVYCHKDPTAWLRGLAAGKVHQASAIQLYQLPRRGIEALANGMERRNAWSLSRMDGIVYLEIEEETTELEVATLLWPTA